MAMSYSKKDLSIPEANIIRAENFITREECLKIYNSSRKVQKTKGYFRGVEFEQYYQNIAKGSIEKLNKLIETFIKATYK